MPPFIQNIDDSFVAFFQQIANPALDAVMAAITSLSDKGIIWIVICLVLIAYKPTRFWGIFAAAALACAWATDELILKSIFLRDRPFVANPDVVLAVNPPHGYSFPSGHSASALVVSTFLLFSPVLKKALKAVIFIYALLVAFSRMYLCVHYFSDVVVGMIVGVVFGVVFGIIATRVAKRRAEKNALNAASGGAGQGAS